jgi:hypothetical protein
MGNGAKWWAKGPQLLQYWHSVLPSRVRNERATTRSSRDRPEMEHDGAGNLKIWQEYLSSLPI